MKGSDKQIVIFSGDGYFVPNEQIPLKYEKCSTIRYKRTQ